MTKDEKKKVRDIMMKLHLKPSLKRPGLYQLVEDIDDASNKTDLTNNDISLLKVFDVRMKNLKQTIRSMASNFTSWQH